MGELTHRMGGLYMLKGLMVHYTSLWEASSQAVFLSTGSGGHHGCPNGPRVLETVEVTTAAKTLLRKKGAKGNQKKT